MVSSGRNAGSSSLLDGLSNPDLAVRIAVNNILCSKIPAIDFDPWAAADERSKAIEQLPKQFAKGG